MYPYDGNDEELISLTCERHIANVGEQEFAVWNWLDLLAHREQPAIHTILKIFHGHGFFTCFFMQQTDASKVKCKLICTANPKHCSRVPSPKAMQCPSLKIQEHPG